jgi:hypothetical protein
MISPLVDQREGFGFFFSRNDGMIRDGRLE